MWEESSGGSQCSKSGKNVVLSGYVSDIGGVFLLISRMMEIEFADGWNFLREIIISQDVGLGYFDAYQSMVRFEAIVNW